MASNMQFLPGDIIQNFEEPFVKYLNDEYKGQHCHSCFLSKPMLRRCADCKMVSYCNSDCQRADWTNSHSIECEIFSKSDVLSSVQEDCHFQVIKLLAYLKKNGVKAKMNYSHYNGTTRCFDDLQDHYSDISNSQTITDSCRTLAMTLTDTNLFTLAESSYENVMHLYGILKTNCFAVRNKETTKIIGVALYISASAFDHSCRPNALHLADTSFRLQVRCIDAIPFGEAPKISYLNSANPRNVRQEILSASLYFTCDCELCQMERDAPVVDYNDLKRRVTELLEKTTYTDDDFERAMDFLQDMQKMFCQYDERITIHSHFILQRLVSTLLGSSGHMLTASKVKEFAEQVEENVRITYGTDHSSYKYFVEQLQPSLHEVI